MINYISNPIIKQVVQTYNKYSLQSNFLEYLNHRNIKILDFGCGDGKKLTQFIESGYDAYGADICENVVNSAKKEFSEKNIEIQRIKLIKATTNHNSRIVTSSFHIPFENNTFEIIYAYQVLEHIWDLDIVFRELSRILNDNGIIYLTYPSKYTFIESHLNIPLVHFLPHSKLRATYINLYKKLFFDTKTYDGSSQNDYLKNCVFYRSNKEILKFAKKYFQLCYISQPKLILKKPFIVNHNNQILILKKVKTPIRNSNNNNNIIRQNSKVILFGTGTGATHGYNHIKNRHVILGFSDNNKSKIGQKMFNLPIYDPNILPKIDVDRIIICSMYGKEIAEQLHNNLSIPLNKIEELDSDILIYGKNYSLKNIKAKFLLFIIITTLFTLITKQFI